MQMSEAVEIYSECQIVKDKNYTLDSNIYVLDLIVNTIFYNVQVQHKHI